MSDELFRQNPAIFERRLEDVVFLVNAESETVFHLNDLGAAIWRLFAEPRTIDQVTSIVCQAFPTIDRKRIESDAAKLVAHFTKQGLIYCPNKGRN